MELLGSESEGERTATGSRPKTTERTWNVQFRGEQSPKTHSTSFKLARLLYGGVLAFMAVDNFRDLEGSIEYAESKGAPAAGTSVPLVSGSLLLGGLGIAAWKLPRLAAGAAATFFVTTTPVMHDFWTLEDDQQREQQQIHFLKNTALLGAALAFLRIAQDDDA